MSGMIDSDYIKTCLINDFRFERRCDFIATEAGGFLADFLAITSDRKKLIEVEVKISKFDLLSDLKKVKHKYYEKPLYDFYWKKELEKPNPFIPNQFYFAVPKFLENDALELTKDTKYGVIVCHFNQERRVFDGSTVIVKKAKKIHSHPVQEVALHSLAMRMVSELAKLRKIEELRKGTIINSNDSHKDSRRSQSNNARIGVKAVNRFANNAITNKIAEENLKSFCNSYCKKVKLNEVELDEFTDCVRARIEYIKRTT